MDNVCFHFFAFLLIQKSILTLSLIFPDRQKYSNPPNENPNYYNPNLAGGPGVPNPGYDPNQGGGPAVPNPGYNPNIGGGGYDRPKKHHKYRKNGLGGNRYGSHNQAANNYDFYNRRVGPPGNQSPLNQQSPGYYPNYQSPYYSGYGQMPRMNCTEKLRRRNCVDVNGPCTMNSHCCTWKCREAQCRPSRSSPCTRDNECNTEICLTKFDICKCSCANFGRKCTDNNDCCFGVCNKTSEVKSKLICVCRQIGETCDTKNDCCGENWMCANGICTDETIEVVAVANLKIIPEITTQSDAAVTIYVIPELEPEKGNNLKPVIKAEIKPNASAKTELEMTTKMETNTKPETELEASTKTDKI